MSQKLVSLVFRIHREKLDEVKALSKETRVRQSEFLREAVADLLLKHEAKLGVEL